ncbi:MAG: TonB family protein [Halopseudomonas aestusnigri]
MQGVTAIRWSSSILTAITLHTVCWFWADQILPPDIATSQPPQRLTITISKNKTSTNSTLSIQEPLPLPTLPPAVVSTKSVKQEQIVQSASVARQKPQKKAVTNKPELALEPINIKPRWKPQAPARKPVREAAQQQRETLLVATQKEKPNKRPQPKQLQVVKTDVSVVNKMSAIAASLSSVEQAPLSKSSAPQHQTIASASPVVTPTFKNLPLVTQPAFSKPPTPPQYPKRAKRKRLQGQVILRARVDEQGSVEHIVIWQSSGYKLLDKAAEKAMWDWQFTPAKQAGIRTASWVEFPVNFAIR